MRKLKTLLSLITVLCVLASTFAYVPMVANATEIIDAPYTPNEFLVSVNGSSYSYSSVLSQIINIVNDNSNSETSFNITMSQISETGDYKIYLACLENSNEETDIVNLCDIINSTNSDFDAMPNYLLEPDEITFDENIGLDIDEIDLPYDGNYFAGWHLDDIYADVAEDACSNYGDGIVVAVIDSGCDFSHEHLRGREVNIVTEDNRVVHGFNLSGIGDDYDYDIDDNYGHGTRVASVIAGSNQTNGISGVAKNAKILPIKISDQEEGYTIDNLICAMELVHFYNTELTEFSATPLPKISVVNISMSVELLKYYKSFQNSLKQLFETVSEHCVIVASAGNKGTEEGTFSNSNYLRFPASFDCVVGVMGHGTKRIMLENSSYDATGTHFDIAAPAEAINVAVPSTSGNTYAMKAGTSYACGIISGAVALYLSNCPNATIEQAKNNLIYDVVDKVQPFHELDIPHPKFNLVDYLKKGLIPADSIFTGSCGPNATWIYDHSDRSLTISGEGEMYDYALVNSPWFEYRRLITSCVISNDITEIGDGSFSNVSALKQLTIGNNVTRIGSLAFSNCKNITAINIPSTVVEIGMGAFYNCSSAQTVTLPNVLTSAEQGIFQKCASLTSITIPTEWTSIPIGMFLDCSSLQSVTLPDTITVIDSISFKNCTNLQNINMPENLVEIKSQAFANCSSLSSLVMPRGMIKIYQKAFSGCTALQNITLYDSITTIGANVFENCPNLTIKAYINSIPLSYAQTNSIDYEIMYRLNALSGSTTAFDRANNYIFGLRAILTQNMFTRQYVQLDEGYTLAFDMTTTRYMGTGTVVSVLKDDTVVETYNIIIFGDVDGNCRIEPSDTLYMRNIIDGLIIEPEGSIKRIAADVYQYGTGLTNEDIEFLNEVIAGTKELSQNPLL